MPLLIVGGAPFELRRGGAVALCAGLLRSYKGVELLLEAWSRSVLPRDARLLIAGESYLGRRAARRLAGRVRDGMNVDWYERWLSDGEMWELMLGADVFVLPHLRASQSGLLPIALEDLRHRLEPVERVVQRLLANPPGERLLADGHHPLVECSAIDGRRIGGRRLRERLK